MCPCPLRALVPPAVPSARNARVLAVAGRPPFATQSQLRAVLSQRAPGHPVSSLTSFCASRLRPCYSQLTRDFMRSSGLYQSLPVPPAGHVFIPPP